GRGRHTGDAATIYLRVGDVRRDSLRTDHLYEDYRGVVMWEVEHAIAVEALPAEVWQAWRDVGRWPEWNADLASAELRGDFEPGGVIVMVLADQTVVELRIAEAEEDRVFVDEAEVGDTTIATTHRVERQEDGASRVTYRLQATGPQEAEIGPAVSADFPDV